VTAGVVSYMLLCCGGGFAGLVSLTSSSYPSPYSPYSLELFVLSRELVGLQGFALCVCVRRLGAFGFLWRENRSVKM